MWGMKQSDREMMSVLVSMISACSGLIVKLLDDQIEIMCLEQVVNIAQLSGFKRARDQFADLSIILDSLTEFPRN
jgi:hypothetical protein